MALPSPSDQNVVFDFTRNEKQRTFFFEVMKAVAGQSDLRYFFYGGAIRGGKTAVCLTIFVLLAKKYPGSRWVVLRDSFTTLEATTIPSFNKFCPEGKVKYRKSPGNYHAEFPNGSKIFFLSESLISDPELTWMLGLECNGILLEQIEGLSEITWQKSLERVGSWYIDPMPPGIILSTFNPTLGWVKNKIYTPHIKGLLKSPYYFLEALPIDNPMVTKDQWSAWKQMDDVTYKRFVEGNWDSFAVNKPFAYAFSEKKHVGEIEYDFDMPALIISFDFNIEPVTCIVAQHDEVNKQLRILDAFKVSGGNSEDLCDLVAAKYGIYFPEYIVTGDGTGHNRSSITGGVITHYYRIKDRLDLASSQVKAPKKNLAPKNLRVITNSALQNYDIIINKETCAPLIFDLRYVEVDEWGDVEKSNRANEKKRADFLDCFNYLCELCFKQEFKHLYKMMREDHIGDLGG